MIFIYLYLEKNITYGMIPGVGEKLPVFWFTDTMYNNTLYLMMTTEIKKPAVLAGIHAGRSRKATNDVNKLSLSLVYKMKRG